MFHPVEIVASWLALAYGDFERKEKVRRMSKNEVINKAIGPTTKMVPTISVDDVIDVYITRWASDPMAQGVYIHIPPNGTMGDCKNLSRSISDRLSSLRVKQQTKYISERCMVPIYQA